MPEKPAPSPTPAANDFPVVGVGASAGGMEALTRLLEKLPANTGMAFVLVQHLDPTHESILAALLSKISALPVAEASDGVRVEPGHVYVIPPNRDMTLADGHLRLEKRTAPRGRHMPIDSFFRSLAEVQGSHAIGVVLSGTGSDGTLGVQAIKAEGGITCAQEPKSAKHDGMPASAIATGCVDFVLTPENIALEILRLDGHPYLKIPRQETELAAPPADDAQLKRIFLLLKRATNVDFTFYRHSTIQRRIARRMLVHKCDTLDNYVGLLNEKPEEIHALYQDILIKVTRFFRDPEVFDFLKQTIFPEFLKNRPPICRSASGFRVARPVRKCIRSRSACSNS